MLRVIEIVETSPYYLQCKFNNGAIKKLDVKPIIEHHLHLSGVEDLLNETIFNKVRIGEFGEIVYYDISPEFAYQNSTFVEAS